MRLKGFLNMLDSSDEYKNLINCINSGETPVNIIGVSESVAAHLILCTSNNTSKLGLVVAPDEAAAKKLFSDLRLFWDESVLYYPDRELIFYDIDTLSKDIISSRLDAINKLANGRARVVVTTISALAGSAPQKSVFENIITFETGGICDIDLAIEAFVRLGYVREDIVEGRGQFAIRGGIIDFFPHTSETPVRIELFSDEIDSIREFDPITQRSLGTINKSSITPANEIILNKEQRNDLVKKLIKLCDRTDNEVLNKNLKRDIERLQNNLYFPSIDKYIPFIYEEIPTLLDYLPDSSLIFLYQPSRIAEIAKSDELRFAEQTAAFAEKGILPSAGMKWRKEYYDTIHEMTRKHSLVGLAGISHSCPDYRPKAVFTFAAKPQAAFYGKIDLFYSAMKFYKRNGYAVIIFGGSEGKAKNIAKLMCDEDIFCVYSDNIDDPPENGQIIITRGEITRGFEYPMQRLAIIGDRDMFGRDKKPSRKVMRKGHEKLSGLTDLSIGDFVVHQNHGIGQFAGIKTMTVDGATSDYLQIKFRGNDTLYVPTNQLDLIYKYIGKSAEHIRLNKLGGSEWQKAKQKVRASAKDMAEQLIKLYAERQNVKGISFTPDREWHKSFAATFPYEETEDQLRCIEEVSADMEKDRPMDRLLCGDVGFGKTEIALRAAFKAVMDGYQVAYLVPTTILAAQHYNTFCERMRDFPVKVEMLSRFRTVKQQKETIKRLKTGEVDIVIGTHRIIQKDIIFKRLGLLIIDEEQRFGVAHKEYIKELKRNVDVLTLTATPIPRTLHMSLSGICDMSVLENPPKDRYPVSTFVMEYNTEVIAEAILREAARGGQVYYLHNKVESIERAAAKISSISEDLRVAVAHGKMRESELEDIMQQVLDGEVDVLVCTTIIETGLDIPNINTIIVEDADKMGLSQLYQLRGRVGRSNTLAYAYLTYRRDKNLSEIAEKRLRAIRDFTEFGSGFKIALRDLEIRGAGNVLGADQHGHMEAVGYEMYCKLLSEAVSQLKGQTSVPEIQTVISLNVNAYIPKDYITGENYRIEAYKKIASIENQQDYMDVYDEIQDRYGNVPGSVSNLLDIALIKSYATSLGIEEIRQTKNAVIFTYSQSMPPDIKVISELLKNESKGLMFSAGTKPYITLKHKGKDLLSNIKSLLQKYKQLQTSDK